jgi:hypothetical protein
LEPEFGIIRRTLLLRIRLKIGAKVALGLGIESEITIMARRNAMVTLVI